MLKLSSMPRPRSPATASAAVEKRTARVANLRRKAASEFQVMLTKGIRILIGPSMRKSMMKRVLKALCAAVAPAQDVDLVSDEANPMTDDHLDIEDVCGRFVHFSSPSLGGLDDLCPALFATPDRR